MSQHFQNFIEFFRNTEIKIGLITSSGCFKFPSKTNKEGFTKISKAQLSKWVENGEIAIVIGTHSLIQKNVKFKHLGLCIIDEQHRFGVKQRKALADKRGSHNTSLVPHFLSMTATPIPRTLALTIYGDLDLSLLDEMPPGRKNPITTIVNPHERETMYSEIKKELEKGRQLYVICPRISDPDEKKENALILKSVKTEAERLSKLVFKNYNIDILHSKMKPEEKETVMANFKDKKVDILVATSVVEVGVNVQNANMIIIEGAERFGLSQLHQLRGRVIRGTHQPYCYIAIDKAVDKSMQRLKSLCDVKNGFELAEIDLDLRGSGGLNEGKQWGISDIAMEAIKNVKLVKKTTFPTIT